MLVVDARAGPAARATPRCRDPARAAEVPVIVVANKIDSPATSQLAAELHELGLGRAARRSRPPTASAPATCSTASPTSPASRGRRRRADEDRARCASRVIGRPNVGKSSLVNALPRRRAGDRLRDGRDDPRRDRHRARVRGPQLVLSTPPGCAGGPRSPGTVDYYAQLRSERAAERADVAIVVCDASEGVTAEDLRVAELAMRSGCATLRRAEQVGRRARPTSRTHAPGSSSACACARR